MVTKIAGRSMEHGEYGDEPLVSNTFMTTHRYRQQSLARKDLVTCRLFPSGICLKSLSSLFSTIDWSCICST